jgi:hypothetical protein
VSSDDYDPLGGIIDPLEHASYEIDRSTNIFEAMEIIKSKRKIEGNANEWIKIKKPELVALIVEAFVDPDKKKILNIISNKPTTIPQILEICNLEPTNGYRKIKSLIKSGLIKPMDYVTAHNRRKIKNYMTVIEDAKIYIDKNIISVLVRFKKNIPV